MLRSRFAGFAGIIVFVGLLGFVFVGESFAQGGAHNRRSYEDWWRIYIDQAKAACAKPADPAQPWMFSEPGSCAKNFVQCMGSGDVKADHQIMRDQFRYDFSDGSVLPQVMHVDDGPYDEYSFARGDIPPILQDGWDGSLPRGLDGSDSNAELNRASTRVRLVNAASFCVAALQKMSRACDSSAGRAQGEICKDSFVQCLGDRPTASRVGEVGYDVYKDFLINDVGEPKGILDFENEQVGLQEGVPWLICADHAGDVAEIAADEVRRNGNPNWESSATRKAQDEHPFYRDDQGVFENLWEHGKDTWAYFFDKGTEIACDGAEWALEPVTGPGLSSCFTCVVVWAVLRALGDVGPMGFILLVQPALMLAGSVFLLWGGFVLMQHAIGSARGQAPAMAVMIRAFMLAFAVLMLGVGTGAGGAGMRNAYGFLSQEVVGPVLNAGISAGSGLMLTSTVGNASYRKIVSDGFQESKQFVDEQRANGNGVSGGMESVAHGVMDFLSVLHGVGKLGILKGLTLMCDGPTAQGFLERLVAFLGGMFVVLLYFLFLITAGFRLIDPLIRSIVVLSLSPLLIVAAVFPATRQASIAGVRNIAWSAVYLMLLGLAISLAVMLLSSVMDTVIKPTASPSTRNFTGGGLDVVGPIVAVVVVILAQSLLGVASTVAGQLVSFTPAGGVADQAETQTRGFTQRGLGTAIHIGASGAMMMMSRASQVARSGKLAGLARKGVSGGI